MANGSMARIAVAASLVLTACSSAQPRPGAREGELAALADRYFQEVFFKYSPTRGTRAGLHAYDTRLEDFSRAAIEARVAALKDFENRIESVPVPRASADVAADRQLLLSDIRSSLLELTTIRRWEKDPNLYSSGITESASAAFKEAKDADTLREFARSNAQVLSALRAYQQFLQDDLLPRSGGDYRIGADTYRKKLLFDEAVDLPLEELLKIGMADLRRNQREFERVAKQLAPDRTPEQVLLDLGADHPPPAGLLQAFRDTFGDLRGFIDSRRIVTIPSPVPPIVEETPPFMRALTFASMDTPGPFEKQAKEAFFNVTLPEQTWTLEQVEEHMAGFNRGTVISTAIHEAYPGHYLQFLWVQRAPNKVRQLLGCGSNAEGWAHYSEQMMLDEGYGRAPGVAEEDDAAFLKLRLGQLQDALLRNARYVVGIRMHTGDMTFEQAVEFFEKEGYQSHANALRETKRGTSDPTYLVYTLGKLQILKLRDDYRRKAGGSFRLQEFHDAFLRQGFPPVKIIRRAMLGDDGPTL